MASSSSAVVPKDKNKNDVMELKEIGLDGLIRCHKSDILRFSDIDVTKAVTGKNNDEAGLALRRLAQDKVVEIYKDSATYKFKGRGQYDSTLITYTGVIKLIMALSGKNAELLRTKFAKILLRYFAGDASLMDEIEQNRESTNPINVFAREDLAASGAVANPQDTTVARLTEYENRLAILEARDQKLHAKIAKSERIKMLNDIKSAHKRQIAIIEKENEAAIKKQRMLSELEIEMKVKREEAEYRILEKRLPLLKQHDEIEETKFKREMMLLEKQIQLKSTTPASAPTPKLPSGALTARVVGDFFGLFKDVSTKFVIRICNSAMKTIQAHPHNIEPLGYVEDKLIGKRHPHFRSEDIGILKKVLEFCKMEEEKYENIKATPEDIPTATVVG